MGNKIFLIENNHYVLEAMSLILEHEEGFELVGKADHSDSELLYNLPDAPDVILWDMNEMDTSRPEDFSSIRHQYPGVILVATSLRPENHLQAQKAGMDAFLVKHLLPGQFLTKLISILKKHQKHTNHFSAI